MGKPIITKFSTDDLVNPVTVDFVVGTDSTDVSDDLILLGVYFKAVNSISETITVTRISVKGSTFTYLLDSTTLSSGKTVVFTPTGKIGFKKGDTCRVEITSATATGNGSTEIQMQQAT